MPSGASGIQDAADVSREVRMKVSAPLLLVLVTACAKQSSLESSKPHESQVTERAAPELSDAGLVLQEVDLDRDKRPEVLNYLRIREDGSRSLVRKELDLDRDGRIDVRSFFDDKGVLVREEMDADRDGQFDHTDVYQDGIRVMSEYDTDQDGVANVHKYYVRSASGVAVLDRKERDEDGDGKIDLWERFDESGQVVRTGRDLDGDGKMDVREE